VSGDKRSSLTWRGQFKDIANKTSVHNFFSSTEDVLGAIAGSPTSITIHNAFGIVANDVGILGRYAWTVQEKAKGNQFTIIFPWKLTIQGSNYGGWGMNLKDPLLNNDPLYWKWVNSDNYIGRMIKTPEEIGTVSDAVLRRHPVFEPGWGEIGGQQQENTVSNVSPVDGAPSWIFNLYSAQGSALSADATNRSRLLSEAIPALTQPAGANYTSAFVTAKNHNMPAEYADKANWPDIKVGDIPVWKHGYFREMAYCYIYGLYDEFVFLSN